MTYAESIACKQPPELVACNNSEAMEIHRAGVAVAVIRWHRDSWRLCVPSDYLGAVIPWDVIELAARFKASRGAGQRAFDVPGLEGDGR